MALMHDYAELINELRPTAEQFTEIEQYWVKRIQAFFTSKPFKLESDNSLSVDAAVEHLLRQAAQRRRENPGTMYVGTVLQPSCFVATDYTDGFGRFVTKTPLRCTVYAPPSLPRSARNRTIGSPAMSRSSTSDLPRVR